MRARLLDGTDEGQQQWDQLVSWLNTPPVRALRARQATPAPRAMMAPQRTGLDALMADLG